MDADGDFVVSWHGYGPGDDSELMGSGVFARRFNAAGQPLGGEFRANTTTTGLQADPTVAMDANGDFVVAWEGWDQDGSGLGVFAQRYSAAGEPRGQEFLVNDYTANTQSDPVVAMDADGDFVVAWRSFGQDDSDFGVFARRFDAAGNPVGGEFRVNTITQGNQSYVSVAMDAGGDFVVAWDSYHSGLDVQAQRFNAAGQPQGGEFQVSMTSQSSADSTVAMDADGDVVVAWNSGDSDGFGIFAQRFEGAERVAGDFDGDGKADLLWRNAVTGTAVVWLMDGETRLAEGSIGIAPLAWQIAGTGDFNGDGKADILWRNGTDGSAVIWQMNGLEKAESAAIGKPPLVWVVEQIRDTDGDGLSDIVWRNAGSGLTLVWRMSGFTKLAAEPIGSVPSDWQLR
jgi:hypothetical protein